MRQTRQNGNAAPLEGECETPAAKVIRLFGTAQAGAIVGLTTDALKKWRRGRSKGGQGGLVPSKYQAIYLREAKAQGLPLTPADFIADPLP